MRYIVSILVIAVIGLWAALPAQAAVKSLTLQVDGLACPFCAYGVEKKLKKIAEIEKLTIDIDAGQIGITVKDGVRLAASGQDDQAGAGLVARIRKAVREGGFTPREIQATVEGEVLAHDGGWRLRIPETGELLTLKESDRATALNDASSKGRVVVTGTIQTDGAGVTVTIERIDA